MGDLTITRSVGLKLAVPYSVSKAALNALVAKYHAQYADQGILFLAVCPGFVDTGHQDTRECGAKTPAALLAAI